MITDPVIADAFLDRLEVGLGMSESKLLGVLRLPIHTATHIRAVLVNMGHKTFKAAETICFV